MSNLSIRSVVNKGKECLMRPDLSRRTFVGAGLATLAAAKSGVASAAPGREPRGGAPSPELKPFVDELPIPEVLEGDRTVVIGQSEHRFHRELDVAPAWSYGAAGALGPTIQAHAGQPINLTFDNRLGAHLFAKYVDMTLDGATEEDRVRPRANVHVHGALTPPQFDGHPEDTFRPGESKTYTFAHHIEAAGLWYHDHSMGITRLNVAAGLAASYWLRDNFDTGSATNPLRLPSGEFEIPLVIADRRFHDDGSVNYRCQRQIPDGQWEGVMIGDTTTVNGKVMPHLKVARGLYRFRLLNGSNFRTYNLFFSDRMPFWVIGNDGGLLDAPVRTSSVRMMPAERCDILVDFSGLDAGESVELSNDEYPSETIQKLTGATVVPRVMRFTAGRTAGRPGEVPGQLRGGRLQPPLLAPVYTPRRRRIVTLNMDDRPNAPKDGMQVGMTLSNLCFHDEPIEMPRQGTTEVWEFVNTSVDDHPMHLHLVDMRIINRQALDVDAYVRAHPKPARGTRWAPAPDRFLTGRPQRPAAWEGGPKDTVRCPVNSVTRVMIRWPTAEELGFDPDAVFTSAMGHDLQGYVWHCHLIDHEDECMMSRFRTVA
ncbi:multicopper oxidase domain-containing protein [Streptomyces sp. SB3404]|uniref:Multicopper oxidase domain-containing protein n=2 Tax=Streptomyces boncukensis TaxID=2711219 RepID=A0A6G4WPU2_9ACTN|nr:multicopper oxidase domain-containing protein [Streptomyces boncukensis]